MTYEVVTRLPSGKERVQTYASDDPLGVGDVLPLGGRFWLLESIEEPQGETGLPRAVAKPARLPGSRRPRRLTPAALPEVRHRVPL